MTTGKTIALIRWTFVSKVMSLLFNMLSRFVTAFLPTSKHLLISWLQSPSAVILELKKIKSVTVSNVSHCICHEVMGPDAMIFELKKIKSVTVTIISPSISWDCYLSFGAPGSPDMPFYSENRRSGLVWIPILLSTVKCHWSRKIILPSRIMGPCL